MGLPTAQVLWSETRQRFLLFGRCLIVETLGNLWIDGRPHKPLYGRDRLADGREDLDQLPPDMKVVAAARERHSILSIQVAGYRLLRTAALIYYFNHQIPLSFRALTLSSMGSGNW